MCDHQNIEKVEEGPEIGSSQDDSGYLTNTTVSFEQVDSVDRIPTRVAMAINMDLDEYSTPVAGVGKINRTTLYTPKNLDGILCDAIKPSATSNLTRSVAVSKIKDSNSPVHKAGKPIVFYSDENPRVKFSDRYGRMMRNRLHSIDFPRDRLMYQGWISMDVQDATVLPDTQIDFIKKLFTERFLDEIALKIFRNLQPEDLLSASKVSKFWKSIIKKDKVLTNKLKLHKVKLMSQISCVEGHKENVSAGAGERRRSSCTDVMNIVSKKTRGDTFQHPLASAVCFAEIARKTGRWLRLCPECSHPAEVEEGSAAHCLRDDCGLRFCSKCLFAVHGAKNCWPLERDSPMKVVIGGKKSKKNLKRL